MNVAATGDLVAEFDVEEVLDEDLAPSWNVAPTDPVRVVVKRRPSRDRETAPVRQLRSVQWGLLPGWSKSRSGGAKMINARSETVASKPAFKAAAARRRCLVPALGYYEWQRTDQGKIPYFLHDPEDRTLAMAGLYELWLDESLPEDAPDRWLWSCTIITHPATDALGAIHDRCPVLVPRDLQEQWLTCAHDDPDVAARLLTAMPEPHLVPRRVGRAAGNVRNNGPELIEPTVDDPQETLALQLPDASDDSSGDDDAAPHPGARLRREMPQRRAAAD